ncbi:hypothetical protein [Bacillus cereus group sp. BfR-BA-01310]|uniref:hypothetical protein n=1 Tax=Bacillus cereus group sp. BfR-BA-01310 TaxID=2920287 RepID=UPI001F5ACCCA|nr:hypothetical protein [Bacillus cereus group sp. BfR-BA-01310]
MFQKFKFYLMSILISSMLGGIIIGANFLVHNIYNLVSGKEYHLNMWSSIIIFSVVFISGFSYSLKKGPDIFIND